MIEQWLTEEDLKIIYIHECQVDAGDQPDVPKRDPAVDYLAESLAACKELMKKHETVSYFNGVKNVEVCPECGCGKFDGEAEHTLNCAWAKQLAGLPRRIETEEPPESEA